MSGYRDLEVFQLAKRLAVDVHNLSMQLPRFEMYEEGSQVRRSAKAVGALIVEAYGRKRYPADHVKHLVMALTECDETLYHLDILVETGSLGKPNDIKDIADLYTVLSKKLNTLIKYTDKGRSDAPSRRCDDDDFDENDFRL